jgi:hypothetical protein
MYHKQTPLTDEEMLIHLEGDVSEADLEESDEKSEIVNAVQQDPGISATPFIQGLDPDMVEVQSHRGVDEDDVPLAKRILSLNERNNTANTVPQELQCDSRRKLWWRMKNIEEIDAVCNVSFSDPPDDEMTPLQYFKEMCSDDIIQNLADQL